MTDRMDRATAEEIAYDGALAHIAMGTARDTTRSAMLRDLPLISQDAADDILADALRDALASGVDRADIDGSWSA